MINEAFNPCFNTLTPTNKLNFIGAVHRYFDKYTTECNDDTKTEYIKNYNQKVFPIIDPGLPIEEYDEDYIEALISRIQTTNEFINSTIQGRYRNLIIAPCEKYFNDINNFIETSPLWGAGYRFQKANSESIEAALLLIPKSFSIETEKKAAELLSDYKTNDGSRIGLAIMLWVGVRNNEAVGFNFGDIIEMTDHPGVYTIRLVRTSIRDDNDRKAGGKTSNAPRRLPLTEGFVNFIKNRMDYICSQITFPYTDKNGVVFNSILEMPIACKRNEFSIPCSANDLTASGRAFLRNELKMNEHDVSGISYLIRHDENTSEKDPTTYLFRRNFATHLYTLGFPIEWRQYYMGHMIEDDVLKRWDFNDEGYLYEMAQLLEKHPLNNPVSQPLTITIPSGIQNHFIAIENKELNDPIQLSFNSTDYQAKIYAIKSFSKLPVEIDITKYFQL